ncbi:hypothetical protein GE107_21565 [Cohnella sp. CFH 77786]|uniref:hypothetical protein n=1 Tax=Cohnella sp. CFH 77786 TaxID=2662265 RepID=UPI001C60B89A|nr:hypothetical protein [Cohnella sp. CFH 77786]MBW5448639.1 hypothetical protein [Cohnella sp. CFH 77786]
MKRLAVILSIFTVFSLFQTDSIYAYGFLVKQATMKNESITIKHHEEYIEYLSKDNHSLGSGNFTPYVIEDSFFIKRNEIIDLPFVEKISLEYSERGMLRMSITFMNGSQILIKFTALDASLQRINEEDSGDALIYNYPDFVPIRLLYEQAGYKVDYHNEDFESITITP